MSYRQICLDNLEKVKDVLDRLANETSFRKETTVNGVRVYPTGKNVWWATCGEIYGSCNTSAKRMDYSTEKIDGLRYKSGTYKNVRDSILNADEALIENSLHAADYKE